MKNFKFNKIKSVIIMSSVFLPLLTFARSHNLPSFGGFTIFGGRARPTSSFGLCYVVDIMNRFITWGQVILFSIAVIMALYAAYLYITEGYGGKGENVTKAKNTLVYAAVGVGVALLAYAIVPLVSSFLGVSYSEQCF